MHLSMVLPKDRGGGGGAFEGRATQVNLTFSGFQMSIFSPLGLHYKSYSHPWGPQIVFCYCGPELIRMSFNLTFRVY